MSRSRWVMSLVVCVLLGVLTTLALSWAAPLLVAMYRPAPKLDWSKEKFWITDRYAGHYIRTDQPFSSTVKMMHIIYEGAAGDKDYYKRNEPPVWAHKLLHSMKGEGAAAREIWWSVDTVAAGWPFRAFRGAEYEPFQGETESAPMAMVPDGKGGFTLAANMTKPQLRVGLVKFGGASGDKFAVPLEPMARGLAFNVAAFAGAWWMVLFAFGAARRVVRGRRGRCVRCGYDRRGLTLEVACPECGRSSV